MTVQIKGIYEPAGPAEGMRVLVDRVWPQRISRFDARIALWAKDVAPSTELRRWFGHKPERWAEFRRRYCAELVQNAAVDELKKLVRGKSVTLLYAARDTEHNHALVLATHLVRKPRRPATPLC